jgi:hypothetical protein
MTIDHIYRPALDARIREAYRAAFTDWSGRELSVRHAVEVTGASRAYVEALVSRERLDTYA